MRCSLNHGHVLFDDLSIDTKNIFEHQFVLRNLVTISPKADINSETKYFGFIP